MKILKRTLMVMLVFVICMQLFGCEKKYDDISSHKAAQGDSVISEKPITLEAFYPASKSDDGQWEIFEEAAKLTNVSIKVTVAKSNSDMKQSFNLMLASGDIPDIVQCINGKEFSEHGMAGAFVPLNEYLDEFAPNFKRVLDENPEIRKRITAADGNIYYFPHIPGGNASTGWFIRTDWLKKLNMEVPENTEELYEVYKAFRENDPNGNGKKDEVPYFGSIDNLFPLWNARPGWYVEGKKIEYGPYNNEFKEAVENIVNWYKEGLIDKEILARSGDPRVMMLNDNIGGSTDNWFGSTARYNDNLKDTISGFEFMPIAPPSGVELNRRPISSLYGWGVSSGSKYIEEAVRYLDFWYSEEGNRLMNFGVEGVHYDMVDGKPQFKSELLAKPDFQTEIVNFGVQMDIGFCQDFEYEKQWLNEHAIKGQEMYENSDYIVEQVPPVDMRFTEEEREEYTEIYTQIDTYVDETLAKWILGSAKFSDESWKEYVTQLEKFGVKRMIEIENNAYKKYNK